MSDGRPRLEPTGTDLGAAVRHLLDTGDMSGVPWILDTLEEFGRRATAASFRRLLASVAQAESGGYWSPSYPDRPRWWNDFRREVERLFFFDLYTLPSVLGACKVVRDAHAQHERDAVGSLFEGSEDVLASLGPLPTSPLQGPYIPLPPNERGGQ